MIFSSCGIRCLIKSFLHLLYTLCGITGRLQSSDSPYEVVGAYIDASRTRTYRTIPSKVSCPKKKRVEGLVHKRGRGRWPIDTPKTLRALPFFLHRRRLARAIDPGQYASKHWQHDATSTNSDYTRDSVLCPSSVVRNFIQASALSIAGSGICAACSDRSSYSSIQ